MYNIHSGVFRWQMPDILSGADSNVCSISYRLRDICKSNKMSKSFSLKNEGQGEVEEKRKLRQNFSYTAYYVYAKGYKH